MGKKEKSISNKYALVKSRLHLDEIGERLKQIQKELMDKNGGHFAQQKMGEISGATQAQISQYMKGKKIPKLETLDRLASYSGHSLSWLVYGEEEISTDQKERLTIRQYGQILYWLIQLTGAKVEEDPEGVKVVFSENFMNTDYANNGPYPIPWNESQTTMNGNGYPFQYNFAAWQIEKLLATVAATQKADNSLRASPGMDKKTFNILQRTFKETTAQALNALVNETPLQAYETEKTAHMRDDYWDDDDM